jgi:hypothetical protein
MRLRRLLRAAAIPAALALTLLGSTVAAAAEPAPATSGTAVVSGTGRLAAAGSGVARVRGTFTITGAMNGGSLLIDGIDRTTAIRVTRWTSKTRVDGDTLLYRGVKGTFTVAGRTIRVTITSPQVRLSPTTVPPTPRRRGLPDQRGPSIRGRGRALDAVDRTPAGRRQAASASWRPTRPGGSVDERRQLADPAPVVRVPRVRREPALAAY